MTNSLSSCWCFGWIRFIAILPITGFLLPMALEHCKSRRDKPAVQYIWVISSVVDDILKRIPGQGVKIVDYARFYEQSPSLCGRHFAFCCSKRREDTCFVWARRRQKARICSWIAEWRTWNESERFSGVIVRIVKRGHFWEGIDFLRFLDFVFLIRDWKVLINIQF